MDAGFIDLDILITRIRNAQSKTYFLDAVKAYKAGALRASMTSVWVALVYDLISKYRELSAMGDAAATAFIASWDNATAANDLTKLLQLERNILEDATNNTQVVNRIGRTHLERLREDRHLCAHPAFSAEAELFEPSPELVRLHLVNSVNLVLSQEPLQGRGIFDLYDVDIQSSGFPTAHARILDYVEQRYLERVRAQNIRNFGTVLAKSFIKGVPAHWEPHQSKVASSLIAVRERAPHAWPDVNLAITRLFDTLDPEFRPRAITFLASFPDFWPLLQEPTRIVLQETVDNVDAANLVDFRILAGVTLPQFRDALIAVIEELTDDQLSSAIALQPLDDLWPKAIEVYQGSASFRGSETNFRNLIAPFAGRLSSEKLGQLLDAVTANGQNWDAADTDTLLTAVLRNTSEDNWPSPEKRTGFYQHVRRRRRLGNYEELITLMETDGWEVPPPEPEPED